MSAHTHSDDNQGALTTPRNATGIYAGQDPKRSRYHANAPTGPPLAVSRAKPFLRKTPTEQLRQVHIENIREQKTYRGFMGSKVKMLQRPKSGANFIVTGGQKQPPTWEELHHISRKSLGPSSTAAYTSHHEDRGRSAPPAAVATVELLSRELERTAVHEQLVGLHDCYRRICKGSTRSLFALLAGSSPRRHIATASGSLSAAVGLSCPSFSVRGYGTNAASQSGRQSGSANTSAPRPSTAGSGRSLLVPQPLFFKRFIEPYKMISSAAVAASTVPAADITGLQEVVSVGQSVPELEQIPPDDMRRVAAASPSLLSPQHYLTEAGANAEQARAADANGTHDSTRPRSQSPAGSMSRHSSPSRVEPIGINVETDDGDAAPPEIDDIDDDDAAEASEPVDEPVLPTNMNVRRQSITERLQKLRLGEFVANAIKEEAEERKKVLKDLMSEHEYLVKIVNNNTGSSMVLH